MGGAGNQVGLVLCVDDVEGMEDSVSVVCHSLRSLHDGRVFVEVVDVV